MMSSEPPHYHYTPQLTFGKSQRQTPMKTNRQKPSIVLIAILVVVIVGQITASILMMVVKRYDCGVPLLLSGILLLIGLSNECKTMRPWKKAHIFNEMETA